jgi:DNA-binding GntR family transcriptional regulator
MSSQSGCLQRLWGGGLALGEQISERTWAQKFGVAQTTIREAINILEREGFVTKESGRSAKVVNLSEEDVVQLYQLRAGIEGMAGYLAASIKAQVSCLEKIVGEMRGAAEAHDSKALTDCDLRFHLELARMSGNAHILANAQKLLRPFFAFVRLRLSANGQGTSAWGQDVEAHQRIVDLTRDGEAELTSITSKNQWLVLHLPQGRIVYPMTNNLKNKVVLLAGGATGNRRECAVVYTREGATVAVGFRTGAKDSQDKPRRPVCSCLHSGSPDTTHAESCYA